MEAGPFVEWGWEGQHQTSSPAGTLTFSRESMCGAPARTFGWRDPGFFHTSFLKDLWPNMVGPPIGQWFICLEQEVFIQINSIPWTQDSSQGVIVYGDMGKAEWDGSNAHADYQPGSLNTTDRLIEDLPNYDIVYHMPMVIFRNRINFPHSGNHERDFPNTGSYPGGECGVLAETMYYYPAENSAKFWYATDYGMFHFCMADSEHDWWEGTEQYRFIEKCLASADKQKQPCLIFAAHRVLGYSSNSWYASEGSFEEPMRRETLQKLWQKYKVEIAFLGHVHNYERIYPIYQREKSHYAGTVNGTFHVIVGRGGSHLSDFMTINTMWNVFKDRDFGFVKLIAFNHSSFLFESKKSNDGKIYDSSTISRDHRDVLAWVSDGCTVTTLAS